MSKLFNGLVCLLLVSFMIIVAGCGEDAQIKEIKNSTVAYSASSKICMLKKIDDAPKIGDAIDILFKDKEWKIENENGRDFVIFKGTLELKGQSPQKILFAFTNKGDYYSLVGMQLDNYRIRNDVQFIYLLAILQAYDPSYDFTKNGIPKEVIDDVKKF